MSWDRLDDWKLLGQKLEESRRLKEAANDDGLKHEAREALIAEARRRPLLTLHNDGTPHGSPSKRWS